MAKVRYTPKQGGAFAPTLEPGQVIEVSFEEAEHLVATGAFERLEAPTELVGESEPQPRPRKGRD